MRINLTTLSTLALSTIAACGGIAGAAAPTMDVLSADRELFVIACGFDYEFDDCDGARESSQATSGFYDNEITADLNDYYGTDISDAEGAIYSNITDQRIELEFFADASVVNTSIFSADAGVYGTADIEFEVLDDVRVVFEAYAEGYYQSYFTAGASLREVGGPLISGFGIQGASDDDTEFVGWLYAGTYSVSADLSASAMATVPSAGELSLSFRIYEMADFNTNGTVDAADFYAFYGQYLSGSANADFNGNGVTDSNDLNAYITSWYAAR
tara:strand:- start:12 stop:824 length:813 start_codon:yes stop_codon:yes gene_type:complete